MANTKRSRPSISKADKNWYSDQELSLIKKAAFDKGFEHFTQTHLKEYSQNIFKIQNKASEFFNVVSQNCGIKFKQIRLKASSINAFELIFLMQEADYLSPETYKKVYNCGLSFIENIEDDFSITFLYMPFSNNLNDNEFLLNGYSFTYDPFRESKN